MKRPQVFELLTPIAVEQSGYVTSQQARAVGVPAWAVLELTDRGLLRRVRRGVYIIEPGRAPSPYEDILSAWLAVDGSALPWQRSDANAIISHASAAALRRLGTIIPGLPEVTVRRHVQRTDMIAHTIRFSREDWDWTRIDGNVRVPATSAARTIVDLWLAHEEVDYLERAVRESFPDSKAAIEELTATARRRRTRSDRLQVALTRLAQSSWPA